jgi:Zn-dependent protease
LHTYVRHFMNNYVYLLLFFFKFHRKSLNEIQKIKAAWKQTIPLALVHLSISFTKR